jgi:DNA-binding response OmpR family regulator
MAKALDHKLTAENFEITVAHNGEEGLDEFKKGSFDLVITDLMMPEMDGFELLEKIGEEDTPIFVLSNLSQKEDKERAEELGAKKFLIKSEVQLNDIVDEVKSFLS